MDEHDDGCLYQNLGPVARDVKAALQMLIGVVTVVAIAWTAWDNVSWAWHHVDTPNKA